MPKFKQSLLIHIMPSTIIWRQCFALWSRRFSADNAVLEYELWMAIQSTDVTGENGVIVPMLKSMHFTGECA